MDFAKDKVNELFIQHKVQNKWFCLREVVRKDNWLADLGRMLVVLINFVLLFSLEINEGEILENPSLFGINYEATKGNSVNSRNPAADILLIHHYDTGHDYEKNTDE